jgi:hypothetical protein
MQTPCNPSYGWSLVFAMTLAITSNTQAQSPSLEVVFQDKGVTTASAKSTKVGSKIPAFEIMAAEQPSPIAIQATTLDSKALAEPQSDKQVVSRPPTSGLEASSSTIPFEARVIIDSRSVACQAANEWLPAKQLRQHAHAVQQLYCKEDDCKRQAANAIARFLQLQANHQQDVAAALVLRAYYAKAAIGEQFELLQESEIELQKQRERQSAIQQKGLAAAVDLTALDREAIALNLQRMQLQQRDRQLRQSLNDATCLQYDWDASTVEPLEVREQALDAAYIERFAVGHRHDLLALQYLSSQINNGTAPMLSSVVSSATGMASLPLPKRCLLDRVLGREDNSVLIKNLNESIAIACETQASAIRREVSEKVIALELAYQKIGLSKEETSSWSIRLEQLRRLAELGDSRPADLVLAQSSLLGAKAIEIERRLEAKLAEIALAEACGGLSARCCQGLAWLVTSQSR